MQPRGLGALLSVAGKPASPSVVGEGAGFCFLFLQVPPSPSLVPACSREVRVERLQGPRAHPPPRAARWPGRQKAQPWGVLGTQEEAR